VDFLAALPLDRKLPVTSMIVIIYFEFAFGRGGGTHQLHQLLLNGFHKPFFSMI
jgi:hypothetical protein